MRPAQGSHHDAAVSPAGPHHPHHQAIDKLGSGLEVLGRGLDGTIEAVGIESTGWARGVQWHPEDTAKSDANQRGLFARLVKEASS